MNYPNLVRVVEDVNNILIINSDELVKINPKFLKLRDGGNFEGMGLYLDECYNWVLGHDNEGLLVLVKLKVEED